MYRNTTLFIILVILLGSCSSEVSTPVNPPQQLLSGPLQSLTNSIFPIDTDPTVFEGINQISNLNTYHFDEGVPWDAAFANDFSQFPQDFQEDIAGYVSLIPDSNQVYVSVTPLSTPFRNEIAPTLLENREFAQQEPWTSRAFNNPDVMTAYLNYCRIMIDQFDPQYFAYTIETNFLWTFADDIVQDEYLELASFVYSSLREEFPDVTIFVTFQVEHFYLSGNTAEQERAIVEVMDFSDIVALSTYPYDNALLFPEGSSADPDNIPADYLTNVLDLVPDKGAVIAETVWTAENMDAPYPRNVISNEQFQAEYVDWIFDQANSQDMAFVNWFFLLDYDQLWEETLQFAPNAAINRIWRDSGFFDGLGNERPSLNRWLITLSD